MGLPRGHVTDPAIWEGMLNARGKPATPAAIRGAQLKAIGNGVVPQQAAAAFAWLLPDLGWRAAGTAGPTPGVESDLLPTPVVNDRGLRGVS